MRATILGFISAVSFVFATAAHAGAYQKDIIEVARAAGNFTTLIKAIEVAGLTETVKTAPALTVLAPTDEAFAALPEGALDKLLADKEALKNVLLYHVIDGKVTSSQVVTLSEATMLNGKKVQIETRDGKVFINGVAVVAVDVDAKNGVIHVIENVLLPE